jgi:hypothetical protein
MLGVMNHDRANDLQAESHPFGEALVVVALAVMAPKGQEAAYALTLEDQAWRSRRGPDASPRFERLVNRSMEQVATSEVFPALWPFEEDRE